MKDVKYAGIWRDEALKMSRESGEWMKIFASSSELEWLLYSFMQFMQPTFLFHRFLTIRSYFVNRTARKNSQLVVKIPVYLSHWQRRKRIICQWFEGKVIIE